MQLYNKKKFLVCGLLTVLWMFFIFSLSSQNGEKTTKLSIVISEYISRLCGVGADAAVIQMHREIRKLAHIGLFFGLGVFSYLLAFYGILADRLHWKRCICILISGVITACYGYFDEWHKQFIVGRHFQPEEVVLNLVSGCVGIMVVMGIQLLWQSYNSRKK